MQQDHRHASSNVETTDPSKRPLKRLKRHGRESTTASGDAHRNLESSEAATPLKSLEKGVSPPAKEVKSTEAEKDNRSEHGTKRRREASVELLRETTFLPSPIQLTRIRDLSAVDNVDSVALKDIVGDPLIVEMWQFNFMFDVDFLIGALDRDVRRSMAIKLIHGSWRREDVQRQMLEQWSRQYPNLEVIQAYMPEAFGTHHSKMMVLVRADDSAQVVIHTANMIPRDWTNMTNAVWRSPLLPLDQKKDAPPGDAKQKTHPIGTGQRFKHDLLRYLSAYGKRLDGLSKRLAMYDFSAVRAALVASTPTRVRLRDARPHEQTSWGWVGLREVLGHIPPSPPVPPSECEDLIVSQVSSIATLDQAGTWLDHFETVLGTVRMDRKVQAPSLHSKSSNGDPTSPAQEYKSTTSTAASAKPSFRIIFPTVTDVHTSLDGYYAGTSIHFKARSAAQRRQLDYLRPRFCRWSTTASQTARRGPAAPHIKTYVRYARGANSAATSTAIRWAMLSSANLSIQAWGALPSTAAAKSGGKKRKSAATAAADAQDAAEVRICSWEIGVVVWPALFLPQAGPADAVAAMVPVFATDAPASASAGGESVVVGWRMPYDWPLTPYCLGDEPWSATEAYAVADVKGRVWQGSC